MFITTLKLFKIKKTLFLVLFMCFVLYGCGLSRLPEQPDFVDENQLKTSCDIAWEKIPIPGDQTIFSADFLTPEEGWAIGDYTIYRWHEGVWSRHTEIPIRKLNSIKMISLNDGWIAGSPGVLLRWNGKEWLETISPTQSLLTGLFFLSPDQGWAVGGDWQIGPRDGPISTAWVTIIEWDGDRWQENSISMAENPMAELVSIGMVSLKNGWAAGNGNLLSWNGKVWEQAFIPSQDERNLDFKSISIVGPDEIWMAGEHMESPYRGVVYRWNGTFWKAEIDAHRSFNSISMISSKYGWVGGGDNDHTDGGSILYCWNGEQWIEKESPARRPIQYIFAGSSGEVWLFSGGDGLNAEAVGEVFRSKHTSPRD